LAISINNNYLYTNSNYENTRFKTDFEQKTPKTAQAEYDYLNYTDFYQDTYLVRREFDTITFEVNVSAFAIKHPIGLISTWLVISFTNNSDYEYNMTREAYGDQNNYTLSYTPEGYAPLGFQRVHFRIENATHQHNLGTTFTNFTIRSNSMVGFSSTEYYRGDEVIADIIVDGGITTYSWIASVVNGTSVYRETIESFSGSPFQINFTINEAYDGLNQNYYVVVNMTDGGSNFYADFFGFYVKNTDPVVDINSIVFNPTSVFRAESCNVKVNASDIESDQEDLSVTLNLYNPNGDSVGIFPLSYDDDERIFTGTFTPAINYPKGDYKASFEVSDNNLPDPGIGTAETEIVVKNNPPKIDGFTINELETKERISVAYGEDLIFEFDVDDVEDSIEYITIKLEADDPYADQDDEYEISREYEDDLEITVRTEDLVGGTWTVYIYVTDTDGDSTDLDDDYDTGPQQITIVPDLLSDYFSWITLAIGSIVGLIVGLGFGYFRVKSKYKKIEEQAPIKKKQVKKKKQPKAKVTPSKPKPISGEPREEVEKKEPQKEPAKRKIRRKL
ncbi:MAG: hypothetical protein ACFFAO_05680, partial [Candidatus Hermodarchaeota archaeon]